MPNNRRRGAATERELCAKLTADFGMVIQRKLGQARDSGHDVDLPGYCIEVKRRRRIALVYDAMAQAEPAAKQDGTTPAVFLRADGKGWLVVLRYEDWQQMALKNFDKGTK